MKINPIYQKPYGIWRVTTEGDCEGRSIRDLGVHEGYVDDIAFALADQCAYSLEFHAVNTKNLNMTPKAKKVNISFDIDSGTWDMDKKDLPGFFSHLLVGRDVQVQDCSFFKAVTLVSGRRTQEEIKADALAKLTPEERAALGY